MKSVKNRIVAIALAIATATTTILSSLSIPITANAYNGFENMSETTYQLCTMFGELYDENSYTAKSKVKDNNISIEENEYRKYCNDIVDGYNFSMSQNFNTDHQVLYRNGKEYDPSSQSLCHETNFFAYNDSDVYGAFYGGGYNMSDSRSVIGALDTVEGGRADAGYGGYCIDLQESDKGKLSYLYKSCGTYTDENKYKHNVDVKITVMDYEESNDVCISSSTSVMFTQDEYNQLNSNQRKYLIKLKTAVTYKNSKYMYTVPYGYLSQASSAGVFSKFGRTDKFWSYKGAVMRFTPMRVGIDVASVNWIELKYEFFESGTSTPINVKGYSCWKDIDGYQGVSFPQGTIDKIGAWESSSHFLAHTFTKDGVPYNGYFDRIGTSTNDDDSFAWLYGTFSGKELTTLFSFCGPMDPTDPNKNRTQGIYDNSGNKASNYGDSRLRRKYSSSGTIMNDLPAISIDRDLVINKYVNKNAATVEKYPELSKALRFYIIDSKGYYVNVAEENNSYKYTNSTENQTDNNLLSLNSSGKVFISDLPLDTYSIYEKIDDKYANDHPAIVGKYSMLNQTVNISDGVDWSNPNNVAAYQVDFNNTENPTKVNIAKTITLSDGQTLNANSTNAKKLLDNVQFAIKNSSGKYANISENGNVTWSETKSYFKMPNGTLKNINLPYGKYTLIEEALDNKVNKIWDTNKSVDFIVNGTTGTVDDDGCLTCNITIDNPELYGGISVQKTTETGEDIAGIEFILSGTSESGRNINMSMITDKNGNAKLDNVPVGTYTLSENPDTVNTEKWQVAKDREVTVTAGQKAETNNESVENSKVAPKVGHIKVYKIDRETLKPLAGAEFTVFIDSNKNGTYEKDIDTFVELITTDTNGIAERKSLPITEEYLVKETKAPEGYIIDEKYYPVTLKANETFEVKTNENGFANEPIKGNIKLTKVDEDNLNQLLSNAHFVVYKDTNESGSYDEADVAIGSMTESSKGIYTLDNLRYGKYIVKETKAPDGYVIDEKYYPVNITECKTYVVSNIDNTSLFGNKAKPVSITLTKRIPVNELNGDIWFPHGNPTFILRLKNTTQSSDDFGRTYYKAMEFTKEYVKEHLIEISGKKYVEMSVTFDNLKAGTYTADEAVAGQRYKLKDILNISDNATIKNNKCEFNLAPGQTGKATFFNVKKFWDTNTHNCLCVNIIKK